MNAIGEAYRDVVLPSRILKELKNADVCQAGLEKKEVLQEMFEIRGPKDQSFLKVKGILQIGGWFR